MSLEPAKAPRSAPQLILMDVMGTLVYDPFRIEMPAFLGMSFDDLLASKHPTAWAEFELNQIDEATLFSRFFKDGRTFDGPGLKAITTQSYAWLPGMQSIVEQLVESGVPLHVLSNYPHWYEQIEQALGLSRYLPWSFVSCHTGLRKPDPQAFLQPLSQFNVSPSACLLVDDNAQNISSAQALGIDTITFRDAPSLAAELSTRGLAVEAP